MNEKEGTSSIHEERPGSNPRAALHNPVIGPISQRLAKDFIRQHHYLGTYPGGTQLNIGVFTGHRLCGALTLGAGPANVYRLFEGADRRDLLALTRFCLADDLPLNSESRVLGAVLLQLKKWTVTKFLVTYADPSAGHAGTIYQATNWIYTGLSDATPLYDFGDGVGRRSRTVSHRFGSHSREYFARHGIQVSVIPQSPKHRYVYFLDRSWRTRLRVPELPYPKKELRDERDRHTAL